MEELCPWCRRRRTQEEDEKAESPAQEDGSDKANGSAVDPEKRKEQLRARLESLPEEARRQLESKPYIDAVLMLSKRTPMRLFDLDRRTLQFLDVLEERGKAVEAIEHVMRALTTTERRDVDNWRGYIFNLLRSYDPKAYQDFKDSGVKRETREGLQGQLSLSEARERRKAREEKKEAKRDARPGNGKGEAAKPKAEPALPMGSTALKSSAPAFVPMFAMREQPGEDAHRAADSVLAALAQQRPQQRKKEEEERRQRKQPRSAEAGDGGGARTWKVKGS
eukprot:TRINITY_DN15870_c0_g1_i1.p1 TRINITY_DN15870_c0_g1~~TRINITY_DN15870_c0_g1_i1.p1  ORF type:complete len:279 (+),score=80.53 TRINITY_DN15870_c0_g1_i1:61-897(+)